MPKLKTNRAVRKRFRKTASGRFARRRGMLRHILTSKRPKRKRHLRRSALVHPSDESRIRRMMPYG